LLANYNLWQSQKTQGSKKYFINLLAVLKKNKPGYKFASNLANFANLLANFKNIFINLLAVLKKSLVFHKLLANLQKILKLLANF